MRINSRWKTVALTVIVLAGHQVFAAAGTTQVQGSMHTDHRATPKLVFEPEFEARGVTEPVSIAGAYLEANRELFRLPSSPEDLTVAQVRSSLLGTHVRFQQRLHGIAVKQAEIVVSVSAAGRVARVFNNTYPVLQPVARPDQHFESTSALDIAWNHLRVHGELLDVEPTAELVYRPEGLGFRLVYLTMIAVEAPFGYWQHEIDAVSGTVVSVRRTEISRKTTIDSKPDFSAYTGPVTDRGDALAGLRDRLRARAEAEGGERATVDGSGQVFDPDPRTTLMAENLSDTSPPSTFDPAYFTRTLSEITENGGVYTLVGPWVRIADFEAPFTAPSTTGDGVWTALRGDNAFNDAVTYFHIDQNQRYLQALGFVDATAIQDVSIQTDSDGLSGADNSHYIPGSNRLAFGHGCVDDNEDADVILHEYMHALTHDINHSWGGADTGAMGEGFGDYWGGSYSYSTPNGPDFHPAWAFSWDGHNNCWPGRVMDLPPASNQYDPGCTYTAHGFCGGVSGDELWGSPIFQALVELVALGETREEVDTIILEGQFGLGSGLRMPDMANSIVAAAQGLYPTGPHAAVFHSVFADYNILDLPPLPSPIITYPAGGEVLSGGDAVTVTWDTNGAPGTAVYTVEYTDHCTPDVLFSDDMESGDGNWVATHDPNYGNYDWTLGTANPHSPTHAFFASDPNILSDQYLALASPVTLGGNAELGFWHSYDTESTYDGGVVEISTDGGGSWADLGDAMTANGYNTSSISTGYSSPIGGRSAFSGSSNGYLQTLADLSAWAGDDVKIRFRMATDTSQSGVGWYVDDVTIQSGGSWTEIGTTAAGASSIGWTVPTTEGDDYCVRVIGRAASYSDAMAISGVFSISGSGADLIFADGFESGDTTLWSATTP